MEPNYVFFLFFLISLSSAINISSKRSWAVLESDNVQTASQHDGLPDNNSFGYAPSATCVPARIHIRCQFSIDVDCPRDPANFINYCSKRVLTNGKSSEKGSCNGIVMGDIPSDKNMVSTIITFPLPGQLLLAHTPFVIEFRTSNLNAGSVTNPNSTLYSAPQALQDGNVVGHVHVTIQSLFDYRNDKLENYGVPPDPAKFVFFKTVFGEGDALNGFSVNVSEGLPVGFYRVVERGAQDDCQKFRVI
ncbi:hypothetical protein BDW71DRAFT_216256 [Aspergillus fruticulosus]